MSQSSMLGTVVHESPLRMWRILKEIQQCKLYEKRNFRGASTNGKLAGINANGTVLNEINLSFIVHLSLGKFSFSVHTF